MGGQGLTIIKDDSVSIIDLGRERVMSLTKRSSGEFIFGTHHGNIYKLDNGNLELMQNEVNPSFQNYWSPINSVIEDRHNNLWFCSEGKGILMCSVPF